MLTPEKVLVESKVVKSNKFENNLVMMLCTPSGFSISSFIVVPFPFALFHLDCLSKRLYMLVFLQETMLKVPTPLIW